MNDEQNNNQDNEEICEQCGQNPCVCPKDIDTSDDSEKKQPPKVRWI